MEAPSIEMQNMMLQAITVYLMLERKKETQVRLAFECLVQERHLEFHTDENEESSYKDCENQVCASARQIISQEASPKIEINRISLDILNKYSVNYRKTEHAIQAELIEKGTIIKPEEPSGLILNV